MKKIKNTIAFTIILSALFSLNVFAMKYEDYGYTPPTPLTEQKYDDETLNGRWTWLDDNTCVRFSRYGERASLEKQYKMGLLSRWVERVDNQWSVKTRNTYVGNWSQTTEGIRSFEFNDKTIPVGITKIDGALYAFDGYGELKEGYEYYTGLKTGADGIVTADTEEFNQWLSTQYLPECTSHEAGDNIKTATAAEAIK